MKYLLFAGDKDQAKGGWRDYKGLHDSTEVAGDYARLLSLNPLLCGESFLLYSF